jgi:hypothetical protein
VRNKARVRPLESAHIVSILVGPTTSRSCSSKRTFTNPSADSSCPRSISLLVGWPLLLGSATLMNFEHTSDLRTMGECGDPIVPHGKLARISHTPFCGESRRRARVGFPPALASRHFWIGVAGLNRLQRAFEIAGTIFLVVSRLISRTAPHCLWCGLRRQVLLEIEMFGFSNAGSPRPAGRVPAKDN